MPGSVDITRARGGVLIPPDADFGICVIGTASASPLAAGEVSSPYSSPAAAVEDFGIGDAVDVVTQAITKTDGNPSPFPVCIYRTPSTTPGAYGVIDTSLWTGTATVANATGVAPLGTYQPQGVVVTGGTLGEDGIEIAWSLDNGRTTPGPTPLHTDLSYTFPNSEAGFTFGPSTTNAAYVTLAVELRADTLAHLANVTAHDAADTSAAQIALNASSVPATVSASTAVVNLVLAALVSHVVSIAAHDGPDLVARTALALLSAATDARTGIDLAIALKGILNTHDAVALTASTAGLMGATASIASPQTYTAAVHFLAGGVAALDAQPRRLKITIDGGGTPSDMPDAVTIAGFDVTGAAQTETALDLTGLGTIISAKAWKGAGLSVAFVAADGTGASFQIGYSNGGHNSADATNTITSPDPTYGTLVAGDIVSTSTTAPTWANADLYTAAGVSTDASGAFAAIAESSQSFGLLVLSEPVATANFSTLTTGLNYLATYGKAPPLIVRFRDPTAGETDAAYIVAFRTFAAANHDNRITCVVGRGWLTDLYTGRRYLRSGLAAVIARIQSVSAFPGQEEERLAQHPGWGARGPLENFTVVDDDGKLIGHDEFRRGGIDGPIGTTGGGLTFCYQRLQGVAGTYVSQAPCLYPAGSTILTLMDSRVAAGIERELAAIAWTDIQGADKWDPTTFELDESIRAGMAGKMWAAIRAKFSKEIQNADDPNLVEVTPTVTVSGAQATVFVTVRDRLFGYTNRIAITIAHSR